MYTVQSVITSKESELAFSVPGSVSVSLLLCVFNNSPEILKIRGPHIHGIDQGPK